MRTVGNIERFLVIGIVLVIGAILAVAIKGANDVNSALDPKSVAAKSNERKVDSTALKNGARQQGSKALTNPAQSPDAAARTKSPGVPSDLQPPGSAGNEASIADTLAKAPKAPQSGSGIAGAPTGAATERSAVASPPASGEPAPAPAPLPLKESATDRPGATPDRLAAKASEKPAEKSSDKHDELVYEVRPGDTLERIARSLWGDGQLWRELIAANPAITDAALIHAGMKLRLPKAPTHSHENVTAAAAPPAASSTTKSTSLAAAPAAAATALHRLTDKEKYEVQKGDTLMTIAAAQYGSKSAWKLIYDANSDVIADKDRIKVGTVLKLPAQ